METLIVDNIIYHHMHRRNILQSIGASSASLTVLGTKGVQSSNERRNNEIYSRELKGGVRTNVLDDVKNDENVRKLINEVDDKDWSPKWTGATVNRTQVREKGKSGRYDSVLVEFRRDEKNNDEMFLLWIGNNTLQVEEFGPIIHHFEKYKDDRAKNSNGIYDKSTAYSINDGKISIDSEDFHPDKGSELTLHSSSSGYCEIDVCLVPESDFSLACLARVVANAGLAGISCLGSVVTWPAVIGCIGGLGMTGDQTVQCIDGGYEGCDEVKTVEVEEKWLREEANQPEDNPCEAHGSHNDKTYPMSKEYFEDEVPTAD